MPPSFDHDLVVIGAGAAGLSAAREAQAHGFDALVLEAALRPGGRAHTDVDSLPWPIDLGCHWLHAADVNPFTALADRYGVRYERSVLPIHSGAVAGFDPEEPARMRAALDAFYARIEAEPEDVAAGDVIDPSAPRAAELRSLYTMLVAEPPERCSVRDTQEWLSTGADWIVEDGYGALVQRHGAAARVRLGCPALAVDWSGAGVRVDTPLGAVRARACVVTVSTGVLASEAIRFTPRLPDGVLAAIDAAPLGRAEKVHVAFRRDPWPDLPYHYRLIGDGARALAFHMKPFGRAMATLFAGGDDAGALAALPPADRAAFAVELLVEQWGGAIRREVSGARPTGWTVDPWVRGAYAVTRPGRFAARRGFDEAVGERLLFAGEACSPRSFGTAHGAHESGAAAVRAAAAFISPRQGDAP